MCGLTGFFETIRRTPAIDAEDILRKMTATLVHRGPNSRGVLYDPETGLGLGHTRLSIVDLSTAGHQPMTSQNGRYTIVFNGEIYNFADLRSELESAGCTFRGTGDTEVLLAGFAIWGIIPTIRKSIGMFAIAVWDKSDRTLTLIRDRFGVKPLYYGCFQGTWLFGSELKPFHQHPAFTKEIDPQVLPLFLRHNYVPGPYSIFKHVFKLPAGTSLRISLEGEAGSPEAYWSLRDDAVRLGQKTPFTGTYREAVDRLDTLLTDAVRLRMVSDVPLGAFLSGGVDSSVITALMQKQSSRPIRTFSIGFEKEAYNEAPFAKAIAQHLGTDHTEHYVSGDEALAVVPMLPQMFDEPFADSSQIPTYLVSRMAREHVTVSLSGDGGDEIFSGYRRYWDPQKIAAIFRWMPRPARQLAALVCRTGVPFAGRFPGRLQSRLRQAGKLLNESSPDEIYLSHMQCWTEAAPGWRNTQPAPTELMNRDAWNISSEADARWMYLDSRTYMPDDVLVKVDRASMAVALEAREPLLDQRVAEFAWSLPPAFKRIEADGKRVLKSVLERYVPLELFERPKQGFGVPMEHWLTDELRPWAEDLLSEQKLNRTGYLNTPLIRTRWYAHTHGSPIWHFQLWGVLMFQAWYDEWMLP